MFSNGTLGAILPAAKDESGQALRSHLIVSDHLTVDVRLPTVTPSCRIQADDEQARQREQDA